MSVGKNTPEQRTEYETRHPNLLEKHVARGALHDSDEHRYSPRCHPGTCSTTLEIIDQWGYGEASNKPIFWLTGGIGAGKSTIARTILDVWLSSGYIATSFFYSWAMTRYSQHYSFVATIAYELARLLPSQRPAMESTIYNEPDLFESSVAQQFKSLVTPSLSEEKTCISSRRPFLVIIDGIDEAYISEEEKRQRLRFLDELAKIAETNSSVRFLVTTRSDPDIEAAFDQKPLSAMSNVLTLDDEPTVEAGIKLFVTNELRELDSRHSVGSNWPSKEYATSLVKSAQRSYLTAATLLRCIAPQPMDHRTAYEAIIQNTRATGPFNGSSTALDALYNYLLDSIPTEAFPTVLSALEFLSLDIRPRGAAFRRMFTGSILDSPQYLERLAHLPFGLVSGHLKYLDMVLRVPRGDNAGNQPIYFRHDSFRQFLLDPARSGRFYISKTQALLHLQINLMKHTFIILSSTHTNSSYDERAIVRTFIKGLSDPVCPPSLELRCALEAHMDRNEDVYFQYLKASGMEKLGPSRRLRLNELITPKEELEVLRYLQRCNIPEIEPSSWRRWLHYFTWLPQITLLSSALG